MSYTVKNLPKGMVELTFTMPIDELKADLVNAAKHLSEEHPIQGFRPGKAPMDVVQQRFGEMAIYEHALEHIVRREYVKAVTSEKMNAYGQPKVDIVKLAPGNPVEFTAVVAVIPHVDSLADFHKITVEQKPVKVEDKQIEDTLKELQKMRTKEVPAAREAKTGDKIVVDMDLMLAGVPLEGGQARDHGIFLDEDYYIPGVKEQVIGLKSGDKKTFSVKFPSDHFQKNIAGKDVDIAVTVKDVFQLETPELDEDFAKKLGQDSIENLRTLLRKNMEEDAENKERQRAELELLEKLVDKSKFGDVPDAVLNDEVERMIDELKRSVAERGVPFEDYLQNIKKSVDDLKLEMTVQGLKRVKTAILIREIAEKESIEASDGDVLEEVQKQMNAYSGNPEAQARVRTDDYQDYLRTTLRNRKVIDVLGKQVVKK